MVTITFEVTEGKTEVSAIGSTGKVDKIDITGTEIEGEFVSFIKKLRAYQMSKQIESAIDPNNWKESSF